MDWVFNCVKLSSPTHKKQVNTMATASDSLPIDSSPEGKDGGMLGKNGKQFTSNQKQILKFIDDFNKGKVTNDFVREFFRTEANLPMEKKSPLYLVLSANIYNFEHLDKLLKDADFEPDAADALRDLIDTIKSELNREKKARKKKKKVPPRRIRRGLLLLQHTRSPMSVLANLKNSSVNLGDGRTSSR